MHSIQIDVFPNGPNWRVMFGDGTVSWRTFEDKGEAIARAKEVARNMSACLNIWNSEGEVQSQRVFGHGEAYVH